MEQYRNPEQGTVMERVLYEVKKVIVGQDHLLERLIVALLARGHILVEGVPGLAKTMAIKTLAESIGGDLDQLAVLHDVIFPVRRQEHLKPCSGEEQGLR